LSANDAWKKKGVKEDFVQIAALSNFAWSTSIANMNYKEDNFFSTLIGQFSQPIRFRALFFH
jgi:hypothetical protein